MTNTDLYDALHDHTPGDRVTMQITIAPAELTDQVELREQTVHGMRCYGVRFGLHSLYHEGDPPDAAPNSVTFWCTAAEGPLLLQALITAAAQLACRLDTGVPVPVPAEAAPTVSPRAWSAAKSTRF